MSDGLFSDERPIELKAHPWLMAKSLAVSVQIQTTVATMLLRGFALFLAFFSLASTRLAPKLDIAINRTHYAACKEHIRWLAMDLSTGGSIGRQLGMLVAVLTIVAPRLILLDPVTPSGAIMLCYRPKRAVQGANISSQAYSL